LDPVREREKRFQEKIKMIEKIHTFLPSEKVGVDGEAVYAPPSERQAEIFRRGMMSLGKN
jgi:hypothetical protein